MTRADEIQVVTPDVCVWQAYEPAVKCDLSSTAIKVGDGLVLVDPIALSPDALAELDSIGRPAAIVCTSANHARAADEFRTKYRIPIAAHREAIAEIGIPIDDVLEAGTRLLDALEVIALPGAAPGEIALFDRRGSLSLGDSVINLPPHGLALLPDKYCSDAALLREALQKLLRYEFRLLTLAHGWPIVESAHERLAALLP